MIPQFGFLFQGKLKDNLDPSSTKTDAEIRRVVDQAGFKIRGVNRDVKDVENEDQVSLNLGRSDCAMTSKMSNTNIEYEIDKSGRNLSNGEKQIINFLRILIRDACIICLDEATSNMDPQTGSFSIKG